MWVFHVNPVFELVTRLIELHLRKIRYGSRVLYFCWIRIKNEVS